MSTDQASSRPDSGASADASAGEKPAQIFREASDGAKRLGDEYMSLASDGVTAAMKSSTEMSRSLSEIGRAYGDAYACYVSTLTEIGRESLACRTPADLIALEKKSIEGMGAVVEASTKVFSGVFSAYSRAMEPIIVQATAPAKMSRPAAE